MARTLFEAVGLWLAERERKGYMVRDEYEPAVIKAFKEYSVPQTGSGSGSGTPETNAVIAADDGDNYRFIGQLQDLAFSLETRLTATKQALEEARKERDLAELRDRQAREDLLRVEKERDDAKAKVAELASDWNAAEDDMERGKQVLAWANDEITTLRTALSAARAELEAGKFEWCEECGGPLSHCGDQDGDGEPELDCKACQLREKLATARTALEAAGKERDEARGQTEALRGALASEVLIEDDYGVHGSTFYTCPFCQMESGAGALNKGIPHDPKCILHGESDPCESITALCADRDASREELTSIRTQLAELRADGEAVDWLEKRLQSGESVDQLWKQSRCTDGLRETIAAAKLEGEGK